MSIERIISIIAPHLCLGCNREGNVLCPECQKSLPPAPHRTILGVPGRIYAATVYASLAKRLVYGLKFDRVRSVADDIGRSIAAQVPADCPAAVVTYVPTATSRVRERGYDQAKLIARAVARELGLPCYPLLARVGQKRQVGQDAAHRIRQAQNALRPRGTVTHVPVLLIDDVLTTGATVAAASTVLMQMGASQVDVAVFAVTDVK